MHCGFQVDLFEFCYTFMAKCGFGKILRKGILHIRIYIHCENYIYASILKPSACPATTAKKVKCHNIFMFAIFYHFKTIFMTFLYKGISSIMNNLLRIEKTFVEIDICSISVKNSPKAKNKYTQQHTQRSTISISLNRCKINRYSRFPWISVIPRKIPKDKFSWDSIIRGGLNWYHYK